MTQMDLLEKYNVSVPRYTSYPPANYFHAVEESAYIEAVKESNRVGRRNLSFYLHIPFCRRLCHYCGCNSYIMPDQGTVDQYVKALHLEIERIASLLDRNRPVSQIHYGGGTPTSLPIPILHELNDHILSLFPCIEGKEISIECHPGYLTHADWEALTKGHFNRFSIGIQDFDEKVLSCVGRQPAALPLQEIMEILRGAGASINMDFLYGLPYQTPESFMESIEKAIALRPDRLVTFGYGHVPWVFKRQLILEKHGLPSGEVKKRMYEQAAERLREAGYKSIGLDHFVLPSDELHVAYEEGLLHRNFQGYCTLRTTGQVYALGVTGISQLDGSYAQNTKDISEYIHAVEAGELPIRKGYFLTAEERIVREVIERLMCNYRISWEELSETLAIPVPEIQKAIRYDESVLDEMAADGILRRENEGIVMTEAGHPFVRNVAASFDPLMQATTKQFSKPI